jgi:Ca-activated chloride channel homolog
MVTSRVISVVLGLCAPVYSYACDLALLLAVDVSGSIDSNEFRIQMDGLADGLRDPIVSDALVRAQAKIMLAQWTGSGRQQVTIPWTAVNSFEELEAFAGKVQNDPRLWRNFSTAIGEALAYSMKEFELVPECPRHLIDLSGDGFSNEGTEPAVLRAQLRAANITVNAIAIEESEPELTAYFYENVIAGDGAFVMSASGFDDYPASIRKKLLREVTQQTAQLRSNGGNPNRQIPSD